MQKILVYSGVSVGFFGYAVYHAYTASQSPSEVLGLMASGNIYSFISTNMAFCLLLLFAKAVQFIFFGELSSQEHKKMWDYMLNYLLWKVLIIGAVLEPSLRDLIVWATWLSIVGLMHTFSCLANERFKNLATYSPNAVWWAHGRIISLLLLLLFADLSWFYSCLALFRQQGQTQVFFLYYECFTLLIDVVQVLVKYIIYLIDVIRGGEWEERPVFSYYTDVGSSIIVLSATLGHYLLILYFHGLSFNLVDLFIFLNIRIVFNSLRSKITSYKTYRRLVVALNTRYDVVTEEELRTLPDNVCAVCREVMTNGRRLPCTHIFHSNCLRSWLEFNHTCPTCRHQLLDEHPPGQARPDQSAQPAQRPANPPPAQPVWGIDTSRWNGWLPNVQVEFVRPGGGGGQPSPMSSPQFAGWVETVRGVIPQAPTDVIVQNLLATNNVEDTINNFLEGRVNYQPVPLPPVTNAQATDTTAAGPSGPPPVSAAASAATAPTTQSSAPTLPPSLRDSFKGSPELRNLSFAQRKQALLDYARQGYLDKQQRLLAESLSQSSGSSPNPDRMNATLHSRSSHPHPE